MASGAHWDPLGQGQLGLVGEPQQRGRESVPPRPGLLPSWTVGLRACEVRVLAWYWHWHWSTGSLAQLPLRPCPSPHVASSSSSSLSSLLALVLIQPRCSAVVNLAATSLLFNTPAATSPCPMTSLLNPSFQVHNLHILVI